MRRDVGVVVMEAGEKGRGWRKGKVVMWEDVGEKAGDIYIDTGG